jgi:Bacterial protein of unknown function (DUF922)
MQVLKKITLAIFFLLPFLTKAQDRDFIEWSPYARLTWNDYLAKPSPVSGAAAITSTAIGVEYHVNDNTLSYSITCRFSKTRSWGRSKTDYILEHEQGHFDITEIFARKLAKELKEYKFNSRTYQDELNKIYKRVMDEKEKYQNKYDKETDYSRNMEKQAEWLDKIQKELEQTDDFANYQSTINI